MIVRLLPKSEIDKKKSEEQRQVIAEGIKIAEKVDLLRETAASEEAALEKYRTESLQDIQKDIQEKQSERDALLEEIRSLIAQRKELLVPLDFKWSEVKELEERLRVKEEELSVLEGTLAEKSVMLEVRRRDIEKSEGKSEDLKRLASAIFAEAEARTKQAKEESAQMRNRAQAELSLVEIRESEVSKKESSISTRESQLKERESRIDVYEADLAKREQTLRAGWRNLEETIKELNHG